MNQQTIDGKCAHSKVRFCNCLVLGCTCVLCADCGNRVERDSISLDAKFENRYGGFG